uniref:ORC-CDC6 family AAA ATPase n=1 Tax=Phocaeicola coprocola TaxID=310298 RepID=UPI003FEF5DAB
MTLDEKLARLDELFGSYKAEWLNEKIFHFFAAPSYFTSLKDKRPCVLMGGRGTGKTTVLRGLSYKGQYALNNDNIDKFDLNSYVGVYFRCDTNHVHAFNGKGIDNETWMKIFAHYFNLILTSEILEFVAWHKELKPDDEVLPERACCLIATSLHLGDDISDYKKLMDVLETAMYKFQADINNIADGNMPMLSLAGDPIKIVTEQAEKLRQFRDKTFYLLIDEYENLLDSQQQIVNTLLKHVPQSYTIKIGVREMGWRVKHTMNPQESVIDPADYVLFNIVDEFTDETPDKFESFARNVCQLRIKDLLEEDGVEFDIEQALGNLPYEEEAVKLGVEQTSLYKNILEYEKKSGMDLDVSPLYKFFLSYWSENHKLMFKDEIADYLSNTKIWNTRYENYKYSLLFKIRTGRGSGGIQKYYAGWSTFVKLANGNIRYLMELVYRSYYLYLQEGGDIAKPVSADIQTKAARNVGWKNLTELEGTWSNGAQLTRMVQTLGTIFSRLAKEGENSAPETVQFEIEGERSERTEELLQAGIMNLALIRMPANKQSGRGSVKEFM